MNIIKDGTGKGFNAQVYENNKLAVDSKSASLQHTISAEENQAYQMIGISTLSSGETIVMQITNRSSSNIVMTYLRHQIVGASGGTAFPNVNNYFSIRLGRTYYSGGTELSPVNVYAGSGNSPNIEAYSDPTLVGTPLEIDRWYTKADGDMYTFNKEGALIIPTNQGFEITYQGDQTSGTIYARVSFIME